MNELTNFNFESFSIRMAMRDGEPWFVAADVCAALEIGNTAMAVGRLDDDERGISSTDTLGGVQQLTVVNESGLYSLILGSRKPEAKRFKKWVTGEVLPSIRRSGMYSIAGNGQPAVPQSLPEALRLAADLAEQKSKAEAALAIAAPKAEALDLLSASDEAVTMTQAAKLLGIKLKTLTQHLHTIGWIYRQNGSWLAYDQHQRNGRLQYKEAHYTDQKTGQNCISPYCHIRPKGLALLAHHFAVDKAA